MTSPANPSNAYTVPPAESLICPASKPPAAA